MTTISGFGDFILLVIEELKAVGIEYLIGGAIAVWPGENRERPRI